MKKRLLSLVLCLVMVFSLFPSFGMNAFAYDVTGSLTVPNLGATYDNKNGSDNAWTASNGTTISGAVDQESSNNPRTSVLTLTNNTGKEATLSFHYSVSLQDRDTSDGSANIDHDPNYTFNVVSGDVTYSGDFSKRLPIGGSIEVTITSATKSWYNIYSTKTEMTLSNISLIVGPASFDLSSTEETLNVGDTATVDVTNLEGCSISATSDNGSIASASYNNDTHQITITGGGAGTTTITVTGTADGNHTSENLVSRTIAVTVNSGETPPTDSPQPTDEPQPATVSYADKVNGKGLSDVNNRDDMYFSKKLIENGNNDYTIELNAYAKGAEVTVGQSNPSDVVLILDTSASMYSALDETVQQVQWYTPEQLYSFAGADGVTPFVYNPNGSRTVTYPIYILKNGDPGFDASKKAADGKDDDYEIFYREGDGTRVYNVSHFSDSSEQGWPEKYSCLGDRISALKFSVIEFLSTVKEKADASGGINVAIVVFSDQNNTKYYTLDGTVDYNTASANHNSTNYYNTVMLNSKTNYEALRTLFAVCLWLPMTVLPIRNLTWVLIWRNGFSTIGIPAVMRR